LLEGVGVAHHRRCIFETGEERWRVNMPPATGLELVWSWFLQRLRS
jgi:hypothetical protein